MVFGMWQRLACCAAALLLFGSSSASAAFELLPNGGLENGAGPKGWAMSTTITGTPGEYRNATEQLDLANNPFSGIPQGLGIYVNSFAGNTDALQDQNKMLNFSLSQTAAATPGKTYTLNADVLMQGQASTYVTMLDMYSPSGAIPSPSTSYLKVEFLDSATPVPNVLASQSLDLRTDTVAPDIWQTHSLTTVAAPAGTTQARVTAAALNMVDSCGQNCYEGHDIYLDNFSLLQNGAFGGEKLTNGNLDAAGAPTGFTVTSNKIDNYQFSTKDYGPHSGNVGMWLRAFQGGDATISSTVGAVAGAQYTFSAWSKWEPDYRGADPASDCQNFLQMAFLDTSGTVIGSPVSLDLRDVQINDETWRQFALPTTTAPTGTVSVRVSAIATGMVQEQWIKQSAMWDDFSLMSSLPQDLPGDYNGNGTVDAADYTIWRDHIGQFFTLLNRDPNNSGAITPADYHFWVSHFGNHLDSGDAAGSLFASAVPEPSSIGLMMASLLAFAGRSTVKRQDR
jgi:hypothetical protein